MTEWAFLLVLAAGCLHALWNFWVKTSSGDLATVWIGLGIAGGILAIPAIALTDRESLTLRALWPIAATSAAHAVYFSALSIAYRHGHISVVYPVSRGLGVVIVAVAAPPLLGDATGTITLIGVALVALCAAAVGLSGRQAGRAAPGLAWAVLTGLSIGAYSLVDKLGAQRLGPLPYLAALCLGTFTLMAPWAWRGLRSRADVLPRLLPGARIGFASMVTYAMVLYALRVSNAPSVLAVRECSVIAGSLLGWWLLHEPLGRAKLIAILGIVAGIVLIRLA